MGTSLWGRRLTRRRLIAGAAVGAAAAAGGGVAAAWLVSSDGGKPSTAAPQAVPSQAIPAPQTSEVTPLAGTALLSFLQPTTGAFERREFALDETIDWASGVLFLNTATGSMDGYRVAKAIDTGYYQIASAGPRFIRAFGGSNPTFLLDRVTGAQHSWDGRFWGLFAASEAFLVFGQVLDFRATGRCVLATADLASAVEFRAGPSGSFGWVIHDGIAAITDVDTLTASLVDLETGASRIVFTAPKDLDGLSSPGLYVQESDINGFTVQARYFRGEPSAQGPHDPVVFLTQRISWDGELLESSASPDWFQSRSPDGSFVVRESTLFSRPASGEGIGEVWPAAVLATRDGNEVLRVRSAALSYGDGLPRQRWLADGSGFVAMIAGGEDAPPVPSAPFRYAIITPRGEITAIPSPPVTPHEWFTSPGIMGPVPSPTNPDLLSFGHFVLYNHRSGAWFIPNIADESGPTHLAPWSAGPREMAIGLGHGGHGGRSAPVLVRPLVERGPLSPEPPMRFKVAGTGSCLNLRDKPDASAAIVGCLPDGTAVELDADGELLWDGAEQPYSYATSTDGSWVLVRRGTAGRAWVSSNYLEWSS